MLPGAAEEYVKKSELKVGDRASLNVKYGDHKGLRQQCAHLLLHDRFEIHHESSRMLC